MPQNYTPEFKKKIIRLRLEEGRTIHSITTEYGISKESIKPSSLIRQRGRHYERNSPFA